MNKISAFTGRYSFLSNFYPVEIEYEKGLRAKSVEHAYQASKATNAKDRDYVLAARTPGQAKKRGRQIDCTGNWEHIKEDVMLNLLDLKFSPGSRLAKRLLGTGEAVLEEGNWWGDQYWGVCDGKGKNRLGVLLMKVRSSLKSIRRPPA